MPRWCLRCLGAPPPAGGVALGTGAIRSPTTADSEALLIAGAEILSPDSGAPAGTCYPLLSASRVVRLSSRRLAASRSHVARMVPATGYSEPVG